MTLKKPVLVCSGVQKGCTIPMGSAPRVIQPVFSHNSDHHTLQQILWLQSQPGLWTWFAVQKTRVLLWCWESIPAGRCCSSPWGVHLEKRRQLCREVLGLWCSQLWLLPQE